MRVTQEEVKGAVEESFRTDWGRIVATLIRQFGDFEMAEDVAQEAFSAALVQWATDGIPSSPRAWITTTARRRAIDSIRRRERHRSILESIAVLHFFVSFCVKAKRKFMNIFSEIIFKQCY